MKIRLRHLVVHTKKSNEKFVFADAVTFLHGPVSTGKSTVARLIDFCLGGELERTPAIQQEFVTAELGLLLGSNECTIERAIDDTKGVRVTWVDENNAVESINAPFQAQENALLNAEVFNFSDLVFHLCGVTPIKVRQRSRDPDSPLVRLSIRDIWWYSYLDQLHLDSSFFRLEDPFKGRKSQDAMRFFTGLHSDRLSQLDADFLRITDEQRTKLAAVQQIRAFMEKFELGSEIEISEQLENTEKALFEATQIRKTLEQKRVTQIHPTDTLRATLRKLSSDIENTRIAIAESEELIAEQRALRSEFITAKLKTERTQAATEILDRVHYTRCPECGADISDRIENHQHCRLCNSHKDEDPKKSSVEVDALRRDLNERIDQIADAIGRREQEVSRMRRQLAHAEQSKSKLDDQLQEELRRYDSAFIESIRDTDRTIATLTEKIRSLSQLGKMPKAINDLETEAGALQGKINSLHNSVNEERDRLFAADANIEAIAAEFRRIMIAVSFPGVAENDKVVIDPRNWRPSVLHNDQEWSFWDTGSGGKKTLFNVCYALALHSVALDRDMPVPPVLIIDSPTKNISDDENPELVKSLYSEIYKLARARNGHGLQFLLIDSDLVDPGEKLEGFYERRLAGAPDAPSLIPYYSGP